MTVSVISGASVALASLQTPATGPSAPDAGTMDLATANAILADYVNSGKKLNHYTQAQTDAASKFIQDMIAAHQDKVDLSQTAQGQTAQGSVTTSNAPSSGASNTGTPAVGSSDGIILQLASALTSGSGAAVDGAIQALAGIVLDNSLVWSLTDQETAQTALGYVQASESFVNLSTSDTQLISQALGASAYDQRVQLIGIRIDYGTTGEMALGATNYNITGDKTLAVFQSLSPADQALWFQATLQGQGYATIQAYTTNLQANDQMNAIVQEALANGTMTSKSEAYSQIKDPIVAAAQKLLQLTPTQSADFTAQAIQIVIQLDKNPTSSTVALPAGALSFLQSASTTPTAAEQALQALQSGSGLSAADQAALATLKAVLQSLEDAKTQPSGKASAGASPQPGGDAPATSITFPPVKAASGGTGLAILSGTIAAGSLVDATA